MKIVAKLNVPDGNYCCGCGHIGKCGDYGYCIIFEEPLECSPKFYLKREKCLEAVTK